jgi:hypothetical protein
VNDVSKELWPSVPVLLGLADSDPEPTILTPRNSKRIKARPKPDKPTEKT